MMAFNWGQYQVAGQHFVSYGAGLVTMAATWGVVTQVDAASLTEHLNDIYNGSVLLAKGLAGLATTAGSIYAGYKAVKAASPKEQMKSVVTNLSAPQLTQIANDVADPGGRAKLINAVAEMPEVKGVVATQSVATSTPSPKVVSTPEAVKT